MKNWQLVVRIFVFLLLCSTLVVFFLTVYYPAQTSLANEPTPPLPDDLDQYLLKTEQAVGPKKDTEKAITWFYPDHRTTEVSIIYLHGFSASRREISPVPEELAQKLGANIFFTRLNGHGLQSDDMGKASAADWIRDANEAMAIGRRIGKKVIIVGTSTGATLGVHLARQYPDNIQALISISANFRPKTAASWLASGLWGPMMAKVLIGDYLAFIPKNEQQAYFWTYKYPSSAISQLMELIKYVHSIDLAQIKNPLLMMYTETDHVVSIGLIKKKFAEFGSPQKVLFRSESSNHVMAGDIISPEGTEPTLQEILKFLKENTP